jgi:hypothetical protein
MLREHGVKRDATYVPRWCRAELHKLSKSDLLEIAYDYAIRSVGEDAGEVAAYNDLRETARTLARCADRKEPRLQRGAELATEARHAG